MQFKRLSANLFLLAALFYTALYCSWYVAYSNDFYYPFIYNVYGVDGYIKKTAPENMPFAHTSSGEHMRLFHGMLGAVEHGGGGLDRLRYHTENGQRQFLTGADLEQMRDVASTIDFYKSLIRLFLVLAAAVCVYMAVTGIDTYEWAVFTRWMSVFFVMFMAVVWGVGLQPVISFCGGLIFSHRADWFFYDPLSLPMLIMPYPAVFTCFFGIMSVTALAVWALLYRFCGWVVSSMATFIRRDQA